MSVLAKEAPLPVAEADTFSVSSYNVLLPNSVDGWWIYKYYQSHVPEDARTWAHRQQKLQNIMLGHPHSNTPLTMSLSGSENGGADIVCIQEASAESFDSDFKFMIDAGYSCVLHNKFRFRSATFWKTARFDLEEEFHKDRTLITLLKLKSGSSDDAAPADCRRVYLVNCHLTGGPNPEKRFRQVHDALDQIRKQNNKLLGSPAGGKGGGKGAAKGAAPAPELKAPGVIVCGDFNEEGESAVTELLTKGEVGPAYRCPSYPTVEITGKNKTQALGSFVDAYPAAYASAGAPPSFIAPNLDASFVLGGDSAGEGGEGAGDQSAVQPTPQLQEALQAAFTKLTDGKEVMDEATVEKWLLAINRQLGRGTEFRNSKAKMEAITAEGGAGMTLKDFTDIYLSELQEGKYWGVDHDLRQALGCPVAGAGEGPAFQTLFDHIFYQQKALELIAVKEALSPDELSQALAGDKPLPNVDQPSDHLIQTAVFRLV